MSSIPRWGLFCIVGLPLAWALWMTGLDVSAWGSDAVQLSLRVSLVQAALSTLAAMAWGALVAAVHEKRVPGGAWLLGFHTSIFVLPVFVISYALYGMFGAQGLVGKYWLTAWGPLATVVVAHAYYNHGFVASQLHTAWRARPAGVEDAARVLGASTWAVRWRTTLPMLVGPALATALLVFLFCFSAFGTILLLGQGQLATLEMMVYGTLQGLFPNPGKAAAIGLLAGLINVVLFVAALRLRRRFEGQGTGTHTPARAGPARSAAAYLLAGISLLPILWVLARGFQLRGTWSLAPWQSALSGPRGFDLLEALGWTFTYAAVAVVAAWLLTMLARRRDEVWLAIPLAVSPMFLGLGLLSLYGPTGLGLAPWALVMLGHVALVWPFMLRTIMPGRAQITRSVTDAATVLGASAKAVTWRIRVGLLRPVWLTACALGAAISFGDVSLSLLLSNARTAPLSVWIYRLDGPFDPLMSARAMALTGLLTVLVLLLVVPRMRRSMA